MWEEFRQLLWPDPRQQELARQSIPMARLARRTALRAASRLPAKTAGGIFAKAMAVKHASDQAPVLARSLADDILRNSELRAVLCPVNTQDTASAA